VFPISYIWQLFFFQMRAEGGSQVIQYTGGQPISTYSAQGTVYTNIEYTGGQQYIYCTRYSLYKYITRSAVHYTTQGTVYTNIEYTGGQQYIYCTRYSLYKYIARSAVHYIYYTRYSLYKYRVHWRSAVHILYKVQFIQIYS